MIIGSQPLPPCRFNEGRRGLTAAAEVRGRGEAARVSDVDLEVRCRDAKPTGAHIRPVWETRDLLLSGAAVSVSQTEASLCGVEAAGVRGTPPQTSRGERRAKPKTSEVGLG